MFLTYTNLNICLYLFYHKTKQGTVRKFAIAHFHTVPYEALYEAIITRYPLRS